MFNEATMQELAAEYPDLDFDRIRAVVQAKIDRGEQVKKPAGLVAYIAKNDGRKYLRGAPPSTAEVADHSGEVHRYAMARCELYSVLAQNKDLPPEHMANEVEARAKQHPFATATEEARILRQWGARWPWQGHEVANVGGQDADIGF